jgi:hypothetical protein
MLDQILAWAVVVLPTVFAVGIEVVSKEIKEHPYWRVGVIVFGIGLSSLTWFQMSRANKEAFFERQTAVEETSQRVSASVSESVTKAVTQQYQGMIAGQEKQISDLQSQLSAQGKKVDVISGSNIVTGKTPVRVELANLPPSLATPVPKIEGIEIISQEALPTSPHPDAPYGVKVIIQTKAEMQPVKLGFECDKEVFYGELMPGANYSGIETVRQGRLTNKSDNSIKKNSWAWAVDDPKFVPEIPWVVRLYGKEPLRVVRGELFH